MSSSSRASISAIPSFSGTPAAAAAAAAAAASIPYAEPDITTILIYASFFLTLSLVNAILDVGLYCGLVGQVLVGVAWGTPGAGWLAPQDEATLTRIGYLGLILLVYEGGLSTTVVGLRRDAWLSAAVAGTGVAASVGLSFALMRIARPTATAVQAFAAGAALSSTSLGTTFTLLGTTGLRATRLGTVLTSAAVLDDVVALALVQVISDLGGGSGESIVAVTVVRPLAVSVGLVVVLGLVCGFVVTPLTGWLRSGSSETGVRGVLRRQVFARQYTPFVIHSALLLGFVAGGTFAGASPLFAAYLAGAAISWWDDKWPPMQQPSTAELSTPSPRPGSSTEDHSPRRRVTSGSSRDGQRVTRSSEEHPAVPETSQPPPRVGRGLLVYEKYYLQPVQRILKPLFFATIGFSIPIRQMFQGGVVWRGIVYALLMAVAKLLTGIWLVRTPWTRAQLLPKRVISLIYQAFSRCCTFKTLGSEKQRQESAENDKGRNRDETNRQDAGRREQEGSSGQRPDPQPESHIQEHVHTGPSATTTSRRPRPRSLYPASIIGSAMVARGEVGFLIASIAQSNGVFSSTTSPGDSSSSQESSTSQLYLVVIWAIVLCTIAGPLGMGTLVRRVLRLQNERKENTGTGGSLAMNGPGGGSCRADMPEGERDDDDPLGSFGVAPAGVLSRLTH